MPVGVVRLVWGFNPQNGRWEGPYPRGFLPAKYCRYRFKRRVNGQLVWMHGDRCRGGYGPRR